MGSESSSEFAARRHGRPAVDSAAEAAPAGRGRGPAVHFADERLAAAVATLPRWLERGATLRILLLAAAALGAAAFLPWAQTVSVPLVVTASTPPRSIRTVEGGTLDRLVAREGQRVARGQVVAVIGQSRYIDALERVEAYSASALRDLRGSRIPALPPEVAVGGEVQTVLDSLSGAVSALRNDSRYDIEGLRIAELRQSLAQLEVRARSQAEGIGLRRSLAEVAADRLRIQEELGRRGLISRDIVFARNQELLQQRIGLNDAVAANQELGRQLADGRAGLAALVADRARTRESGFALALRAAERLQGALESRHRNSRLVAPVAGRLRFTRNRDIGEAVAANEEFAVVVPESNRHRAAGAVPASAAAQVPVGAPVRIQVAAFPPAVYGHVYGRVSSVSEVATGGSYQIVVDLPPGAVTTRGVSLPLRERTAATGLVTTEHTRLYQLIVGTLRAGIAGS